MQFDWIGDSENKFKSLQSLIKYNGGYFKSEKQSKFINDCWGYKRTKEDLKKFFGIAIDDDTANIVEVDAEIVHSYKKGRSRIPYLLIYIIDDEGIVTCYRIHYFGNLKDGARPNPAKTELKWKRG